MNVKIRAIV